MRSFSKRALVPVPSVLLALLAGCIFDEKGAGRGSVVENEVLAGRLFGRDGEPADGALVKAFSVAHVPQKGLGKVGADTSIVYSFRTDEQGVFKAENLPTGQYNFIGELDGDISYQDSIVVGEGTDTIPSDTLKEPGSITGFVTLQPNHDHRTAIIQMLGTHYFTTADSTGRFTFRNVAHGSHPIRVSTTLANYVPAFLEVRVRPGRSDTLDQEIRPVYSGIPVVQGLAAAYDTARSRARISWAAADYAFLKEYLIYRVEAASMSLPAEPIAKVRDTVFIDDLSALALGAWPKPAGKAYPTFDYRVRARNLSDEEGLPFGSVAVEAVPVAAVRTVFTFSALGGESLMASVGDSVRLEGRWGNPTREHVSMEWILGTGEVLRTAPVVGRTGADTLALRLPGTPGAIRLSLRAKDLSGSTWSASADFWAVLDAPKVVVSKDTSVSLGDRINLHGTATQAYGSIVKWEWDIGNTGNFMASRPDTAVQAPRTAGPFLCLLRATDDDGNIGLDTVRVQVQHDPPSARAGADTVVSIQDTVRLHGRGSDAMGRIVSWEWDFGSTGTFHATATGDTAIVSRATPGLEYHILRVTDDDGNTALDTIKVTSFNDLPIVSLLAGHRILSEGGGYRLSAAVTDLGSSMKWEWNIGGAGWTAGRSDTGFVPALPSGSQVVCRVRAIDDDGNASEDDTVITVSKWNLVSKLAFGPLNSEVTYWSAAEMGGRIYFTGGVNSAAQTSFTYSYDPEANAWKSHPRMPETITNHILISVSGRLFVMGGGAFFEFDPGLDAWTRLRNVPVTSGELCVAPLDGKIYFAEHDRFQEYDVLSGTWSARQGLTSVTSKFSILAASEGKIHHLDPYGFHFRYDSASDSWLQKSWTIRKGSAYGAVGVPGRIYAVAGQRFYAYSTAEDTWVERSFLIAPTGQRQIVNLGGKIYALGRGPDSFVLQVYDPADEP